MVLARTWHVYFNPKWSIPLLLTLLHSWTLSNPPLSCRILTSPSNLQGQLSPLESTSATLPQRHSPFWICRRLHLCSSTNNILYIRCWTHCHCQPCLITSGISMINSYLVCWLLHFLRKFSHMWSNAKPLDNYGLLLNVCSHLLPMPT